MTQNESDRRHFLRIPTIFPVVFSIEHNESGDISKKKFQGFTRNISETGVCLEVNDFDETLKGYVGDGISYLVSIEVPYNHEHIDSHVDIVWHEHGSPEKPDQHLIGLHFTDLNKQERKNLFRYALRKKRQPWVILFFIILLTIFGIYYYNNFLSVEKGLHESMQELNKTQTELKKVKVDRERITNLLESHNKKIYIMESKLSEFEKKQKTLNEKVKESEKNIPPEELEKLEKELDDAKMMAGDHLSAKLRAELEIKKILEEKHKILSELAKVKESKQDLENSIKDIEEVSEWIVYSIKMKSGLSFTGELVSENDSQLKIRMGEGILSLDKTKIHVIRELPLKSKIELRSKWVKEEKLKENKRSYSQFGSSSTRGAISEIKIKNRRLFVDNKPFYIKGVAYGIEYPKLASSMHDFKKVPFSFFEKDFEMMKECGINVIRTYEPLNKQLLDLAWKHGIRVIENICYPCDTTDFSSIVHLSVQLDQAIDTILAHKDHPAILMWSIWNDAPWVWGMNGGPFPQEKFSTVNNFLRKIYQEVKRIDPYHPVTASNVLGFKGSNLGFDFLDVLGFNSYLGGMDWYVQEDADKMISELTGISLRTDKPVVILETGFSTFVEGLDQGKIIENQFKTIAANIAGTCIFQWADGWNKSGFPEKQDHHIEEHWGITDGFRNPKSGYKKLKEIYSKIKTDSSGYIE